MNMYNHVPALIKPNVNVAKDICAMIFSSCRNKKFISHLGWFGGEQSNSFEV